MSESEFSVNRGDGTALAGWLFRHPSSKDVCIVCHGMFGHSREGLSPALAAGLGARFCVARFDFVGCGASGGAWNYAGYHDDAADIARVAAHLTERCGLRVVCVVGHSKAGAAALLFAATSPQSADAKVVSLAGRVTFGKPERRFTQAQLAQARAEGSFLHRIRPSDERVWRVTQAALDERQTLQLAQLSRRIAAGRVLHVHGAADELTNVAEADVIRSTVPGAQVCIVDGADHFFRGREVQMVQTVCNWLAQQQQL